MADSDSEEETDYNKESDDDYKYEIGEGFKAKPARESGNWFRKNSYKQKYYR